MTHVLCIKSTKFSKQVIVAGGITVMVDSTFLVAQLVKKHRL